MFTTALTALRNTLAIQNGHKRRRMQRGSKLPVRCRIRQFGREGGMSASPPRSGRLRMTGMSAMGSIADARLQHICAERGCLEQKDGLGRTTANRDGVWFVTRYGFSKKVLRRRPVFRQRTHRGCRHDARRRVASFSLRQLAGKSWRTVIEGDVQVVTSSSA